MQTWLIFALSYAFLHALVAVLDRQVLKNHRIDPVVLSTIRYALNTVFAYIFTVFLLGGVHVSVSLGILLISAFYFFAGITYFYAVKFGEVSKLIPYRDAIVVLLSFFLAITLLPEKFVPVDLFGVVVIAIGGYVVWTDGKIVVPKKSPGLVLIAASAVFLALNGIAVKSAVGSVNPVLLSFLMYALVTFYFVLVSLAAKRKEINETMQVLLSEKRYLALILAASFFAPLGVALQFSALSLQNAAKVLPVSGTLPLFAALIGWLILKEKHGVARVAGAILLVIGIYILSIG